MKFTWIVGMLLLIIPDSICRIEHQNFVVKKKKSVAFSKSNLWSIKRKSAVSCAVYCKTQEMCQSATYDKLSEDCRLDSALFPQMEVSSNAIVFLDSAGMYIFYSKLSVRGHIF